MNYPLILFILVIILIAVWQIHYTWFTPEKFKDDFRKMGDKSEKDKGIFKILNQIFNRRWKDKKVIEMNFWGARIASIILLAAGIILLISEIVSPTYYT